MSNTASEFEQKLEEIWNRHIEMYGRYQTHILRQAIIDLHNSEMEKAEEETASKIFNLAHEYANNDRTMIGSEELRNYHYFNAIHKIGKFPGR